MLRAALEGVAFLLRSKLDGLRGAGCRPEQVIIVGGGSRHAGWRRLLSDVFQLPLLAASSPWLSARGAALIAGVATGLYSGWAEATGSVAPPEPAVGPVLSVPAEQRYQRWRRRP